jgi:histidine triad (HIT) family protein
VDTECLFCRIAAGDAPAEILRATDTMVAFRDSHPRAPTHVLLIPREHIPSLKEIGDEHAGVLVDIVQAAQHLARAEGIDESGWRLLANVGRDSGQAVHHLHFHLLGGRRLGPIG